MGSRSCVGDEFRFPSRLRSVTFTTSPLHVKRGAYQAVPKVRNRVAYSECSHEMKATRKQVLKGMAA